MGKEKKQKKLHSHRLDARIERALSFPPPFGRRFALLGALLYASRRRTQESSIGRLWGGEAPQSRGYPTHPRVESEGGFLLREKAPHTPKETASFLSTANYIVVIE